MKERGEEVRRDLMPILVALGIGVAIGVNWPKIKKNFGPLLAGVEKNYSDLSFATLGAMAGQKEKFEDLMATRKEKTKKHGFSALTRKAKIKP